MKKVVIISLVSLLVLSGITTVFGASLSYWVYEPEGSRAVYNEMIKRFEQETGHTLEITYIPKGDYNTKLNTAIATGVAPDVGYLDQPLVPKFAQDGILLNLEKYANGENGIDRGKYYQGALNTNVVNEELFGLPMNQTTVALYYNKDLISSPPDTWDDLISLGKQLYIPGERAAFEVPPGGGWGAWLFPAFVGSAGGRMVNEDETEVTIGEQPAIDALNLLIEMQNYSDKEVQDSTDAFQNGLVAMKISGPWEINGFKNNYPDLNFGVALIPGKDKNSPHASNIGGEDIVIFKSAKNPDAAWELIQFITYNADNCITISEITGNFPVLLEAATHEKFNNEHLQVFLKQMETAQARPRITEWLKINDEVIGRALDQALSGQLTAEQALKDAQERANAILNR
jgi:multiple sugar transport system substrate-binding protein